jgi:type III secretion system FlhB-like substrate exporter
LPASPARPSTPDTVADAIVARIRALSRSHNINIHEDVGLTELMADLKIGDQVPVAAFAVAADLLFHLLAADQRPAPENAP